MFRLIARIGYTILVLIEAVIILRIVIIILNANTTNTFISWIMSISEKFVMPFDGILSSQFLTIGTVNIELISVVALFFYMIMAFIAIEVIKAFSND